MYVGVARRAGDLSRRRRRQTSRQDEAAAAATEQAAKHGWRWHVWQTLEDPGSSKLAKGVSTFVMLIITISVVNFIVGSQRDPACGYKPSGGFTPEKAYECGAYKLSDDGSALAPTLNGLETFCIMVFTVEYVLRLLCCSVAMRVSSFIFSPLNMIDLIAILPWYLDFVLGALQVEVSVEGLSVLRVIRLLRVVRVFKMSRNFQGLIVLIRTLGRSITAISLLLTFVITLIIVFATLIYQFEGRPPRCKWTAVDGYPERGQFIREDGSESPFLSIPHSFYWVLVRRARPMPPALSARPWLLASPPQLALAGALRHIGATLASLRATQVTMTTVGYGDQYPITDAGKVVAALAMLAGCAAHHPKRPAASACCVLPPRAPAEPRRVPCSRRLIVLTLPITIIGANFDEEAREQQRINDRQRRALARLPNVRVESDGAGAVMAHTVPGFDEAAELVQDHKNNVKMEMEVMLAKLEKDLTESMVKVLLQSRVTKRRKEPGRAPPPK